jgi:hypothetical protein
MVLRQREGVELPPTTHTLVVALVVVQAMLMEAQGGIFKAVAVAGY